MSFNAFLDLFQAELLAVPLAADIADLDAYLAEHKDQCLNQGADLSELVIVLSEEDRALVPFSSGAWGEVRREHCEQLIFRSWLFGVLSYLEKSFKSDMQKADWWRDAMATQRINKAQLLKAERERRGQQVDTLHCLQFGDIGQAAIKDPKWYDLFRFRSRRQAKSTIRGLETLRNNLAHGQDVIPGDWDTIVVLACNVHRLRDITARSRS